MLNSLSTFKENIRSVRDLGILHDYLVANIKSPMDFTDLLRSQIVYSVSALDKLIHDIIRIGVVDIFIGKRSPTPRYLSESISLDVYNSMNSSTIPPKEYYFEKHLTNRIKRVSYQHPNNIADGLSYIWTEKHKWQAISKAMGSNSDDVKRELILIVDRRNLIVHGADVDIQTRQKLIITKADCDGTIAFIENCGKNIVRLVEPVAL